jgi:uncharacterized protein YhaN
MRIDKLELRAFGPFTGVALEFPSGERGLHVIFGRNEAGKSSALRALDAALFGIKGQTNDNFVHEYTALRIALTLANSSGDRISFVRRKARKDPLWNQDESDPVASDALRPFLGSLDSEEFQRVFGLDHVRLRDGSERLLDAAEGVGAAIVGAALGLNDLRAVRAAIKQEEATLFAPRASKPTINAAVTNWKRLQEELRRNSLSASAWTKARQEAERSAGDRANADGLEKELRVRIAELEFVQRNRPRVVRLVALREKLTRLTDVPDLDENFEVRRQAAEEMRHKADVLLGQCREAEKKRREKVESLPSDFAYLDHEQEVQELDDLSRKVEKGITDQVGLRTKAAAAAASRDQVARGLGLTVPLDASKLEDLRITLGNQERCEELLKDHTRITTSLHEIADRLLTLRVDLEACEERLKSCEDAIDPAPLARAVTAAMKLGDIDGQVDRSSAELDRIDRVMKDGLTGLPGFSGSIEDLAARPVVGPEELEDFQRRFNALDEEERRSREKKEELVELRRHLGEEISRLSEQGAVPSEQDLGEARDRRDAQWRLVRRAWLDNEKIEEEARAIDADRPLPESFGRSIEQGDGIGDRLRRESDRVAQIAERRHRHQQTNDDLAALAEAERECARRREQLGGEWKVAWEGSGLEVRSLAQMKDTLTLRGQLLEQAEHQRALVATIEDIAERIAQGRSDLTTAAGSPVLQDANTGRLGPLLQLAADRREALTEGATARGKEERDRERLAKDIRTEELKRQRLDEELAAWKVAFAAATEGLPTREGDPPDRTTLVLRHVTDLLTQSKEEDSFSRRIMKIDADAEDLARRVREFCATHAADLPTEEAGASIKQLVALVQEKKRQQHRREIASTELSEAEGDRREAEGDFELAKRTLTDLAIEAGASGIDDLPELVRRADEKRALRQRVDEDERLLLGEGCSIAETERRVGALDGLDIEVELIPLNERLKTAALEAETKREQASQKRAAFDALEHEAGAAELAAEAAAVAAQLREDVERYARLVLESHMLATAVERFRERHEAPTLRFASKYFEGLTRGRYCRVETDLDGKGQPFFLVREASDSAAKTLDALSDGTRDQLHLALVLGSLEHRFTSGAEPMPLVLDDILVHFDDDRSLAALEVLADFSRTTQVLLLTHHGRIREQAESLGEARGTFIHNLDCA